MNFSSLWHRTDTVERGAERHGLSLVTTVRGEGGQRGSILIRDISDHGFTAECLIRLRKGSSVVVDLPGGKAVDATVVWNRRNRVGVNFKQPIGVSFVLAALGE